MHFDLLGLILRHTLKHLNPAKCVHIVCLFVIAIENVEGQQCVAAGNVAAVAAGVGIGVFIMVGVAVAIAIVIACFIRRRNSKLIVC